MLKAINDLAERAIQKRVFPGCVIGVIQNGEEFVQSFGRHTYVPDSLAVHDTTVYDCASLTKSVVTATLALQLLDSGRLTLPGLLITHLPEYEGGYRDEITIKHLLTYTIGGPKLSEYKDNSPDEILSAVFSYQPQYPPGEHFEYSNLPAFLLGLVVEKILGPLDIAAEENIFATLGMKESTFHPHGAVPTEDEIIDIVHDESARVFSRANRSVGHAGLFSTVPDLLTFCDHLLMHPDDRISSNQIPSVGETGLGWELNQAHFMGTHRTPNTFGKTGFTGCSIVCDIPRHTAIVILSNRTYPKRPGDASAINAFRNDVCDIVFGL